MEEEKELKSILLSNYQDYLILKNKEKEPIDSAPLSATKARGSATQGPFQEEFNYFTYLEETDFQKPIWSSYSASP